MTEPGHVNNLNLGQRTKVPPSHCRPHFPPVLLLILVTKSRRTAQAWTSDAISCDAGLVAAPPKHSRTHCAPVACPRALLPFPRVWCRRRWGNCTRWEWVLRVVPRISIVIFNFASSLLLFILLKPLQPPSSASEHAPPASPEPLPTTAIHVLFLLLPVLLLSFQRRRLPRIRSPLPAPLDVRYAA